MDLQEFSDQFDVLYNSITSNQAPGLDAYEKSVFLTNAQNEIVLKYFNAMLNKTQEGFDDSEIRQIDFSTLIKTVKINSTQFNNAILDNKPNTKSIGFSYTDILAILNEFADVTRGTNTVRLTVVPINYNEYSRLSSKPFKRPNKYQAWRLILEDTENNRTFRAMDIIIGPKDVLDKYTIRYVKKPQAIRLNGLGDMKIDGYSTPQGCELDSIMHPEVVQRAVEMAKAVYTGDLSTQISLGTLSQTQIGNIPQSK